MSHFSTGRVSGDPCPQRNSLGLLSPIKGELTRLFAASLPIQKTFSEAFQDAITFAILLWIWRLP